MHVYVHVQGTIHMQCMYIRVHSGFYGDSIGVRICTCTGTCNMCMYMMYMVMCMCTCRVCTYTVYLWYSNYVMFT